MAQSAEINDLIEKTDWGNESSMKYFLMENQACWHTVSSIECNKTLRSEKSDIDYHLLRTSLFSNMPCKKVKMMEMYMKEMIKRVQQDQPVILSHSDVRRCYTKGSGSIYRQMPVPLGMSGGKALSHFAIFSCWQCSESFIRSWLPIEDIKNLQIEWLEELKQMLSHIVLSRTLQEAAKVGALSWKFVHPPTLYLVRWVSEEHTCEDKKNIIATFYCLCCAAWWCSRHSKIHFSFCTWNKTNKSPSPTDQNLMADKGITKSYLHILQGF